MEKIIISFSEKNADLYLSKQIKKNNEPLNKALFGGGENGIRTHDRVSPIHAFQACAFNHSATSP